MRPPPDYDVVVREIFSDVKIYSAQVHTELVSAFGELLRQAHAAGAREAGERCARIARCGHRGGSAEETANRICDDIRAALSLPAKESEK